MSFSNFSSLPPEQEAAFAVYEERITNASKSGLMAGAIAALVVGFFVVVVSMTVTPKPPGNYSADPGSQTQKAAPSNTVKADTAPAEAPPADTGSGSASSATP